MLIGIDIDHPPLLVNLHDSAHYNVTDIRSIALSQWSYANHTVYLVNDTCHVCVNLTILFIFIGSVARYEALTYVITWKHNPEFGLFLLLTRLINFEVSIFHAIIRFFLHFFIFRWF